MSINVSLRLITLSCIGLCIVLTALVDTSAQACADYSTYAHYTAFEAVGEGRCVAAEGDYLCYGLTDGSVKVVSISDPEDPVEVGHLTSASLNAHWLETNGSLVYIADYDYGIRVADISVPTAPVLIDSVPLSGNPMYVTMQGNHLYVAAGIAGLYILNVDIPSHPVEVGHIGLSGETMDIALDGSIAYVAVNDTKLKVVDVSSPSAPDSIGYAWAWRVTHVHAMGDHVYTLGGTGVMVFDVSNPASPVKVDEVATTATYVDGAIRNDRLYAAGEDYTVTTYDLSNPAEAVPAGDIVTGWDGQRGMNFSDGYCYVASRLGLAVVDLGNGDVLNPVAVCGPLPSGLHGISAFGDHYAFGPTDNGRCFVFDISNPLSPTNIQGPALGIYEERCVSTAAIDGYGDIALVGGATGVHVIDLTDPGSTFVLCFIDLMPPYSVSHNEVLDVDANSDYAFVCWRYTPDQNYTLYDLHVLDLADPDSVYIRSTNGWRGETVSLDGDFAYLAGYDDGVRVLDVSDPTPPVAMDHIPAPDNSTAMVAVDGYAYAGFEAAYGGPYYLQVYDASDPDSLIAHGSIPFGSWIVDIEAVAGIAYVSTTAGGLFACNVSDPDNPYIIGCLAAGDEIWGSDVAGDYILLASDAVGLGLAPLDCTDVAGVPWRGDDDRPSPGDASDLVRVSPNPFRGSATLSFSLSEREHVNLAIYDVTGAQVAVLIDCVMEAGPHALPLQRGGLAPGVYLVKIVTGEGEYTEKAVLLR